MLVGIENNCGEVDKKRRKFRAENKKTRALMVCEQGKNEVVLMEPDDGGGGDDDGDEKPESLRQISQQVLTMEDKIKRWSGDS